MDLVRIQKRNRLVNINSLLEFLIRNNFVAAECEIISSEIRCLITNAFYAKMVNPSGHPISC